MVLRKMDNSVRPAEMSRYHAKLREHPVLRALLVLTMALALITGEAGGQESGVTGLSLLDAVSMTLVGQPAILLQKQQVELGKGVLQSTHGQFDATLGANAFREYANAPLTEQQRRITGRSTAETDSTNMSVSLDKQFRSGIIVSPNLLLSRIEDLSLGAGTLNQASLNFTVVIPLLKGRGKEATAANEMAAEANLEAGILDLSQTISTSVFNTAVAYWSYVEAGQRLDILRDTESRADRLVEDVKKLIEADERPASDIDHLNANLADKTAARVQAEQTLYEARQGLGLAMGLPFDKITCLPRAADPSVEAPIEELPPKTLSLSVLMETAHRHRADLLASNKREESAKILQVAARNNVLPQLDLNLNVGYKGLDQGSDPTEFYTSLPGESGGINASVNLSYRFPIGNNAARGLLKQQESLYRQTLIRTSDLERTILSNIGVVMEALRNSITELRKVRESVAHYRKAVENENIKLRLGMSTILEVVTLEDRLSDALLAETANRRSYADAVVGLRFQTGTLLTVEGDNYSVGMEQLTHIPSL